MQHHASSGKFSNKLVRAMHLIALGIPFTLAACASPDYSKPANLRPSTVTLASEHFLYMQNGRDSYIITLPKDHLGALERSNAALKWLDGIDLKNPVYYINFNTKRQLPIDYHLIPLRDVQEIAFYIAPGKGDPNNPKSGPAVYVGGVVHKYLTAEPTFCPADIKNPTMADCVSASYGMPVTIRQLNAPYKVFKQKWGNIVGLYGWIDHVGQTATVRPISAAEAKKEVNAAIESQAALRQENLRQEQQQREAEQLPRPASQQSHRMTTADYAQICKIASTPVPIAAKMKMHGKNSNAIRKMQEQFADHMINGMKKKGMYNSAPEVEILTAVLMEERDLVNAIVIDHSIWRNPLDAKAAAYRHCMRTLPSGR